MADENVGPTIADINATQAAPSEPVKPIEPDISNFDSTPDEPLPLSPAEGKAFGAAPIEPAPPTPVQGAAPFQPAPMTTSVQGGPQPPQAPPLAPLQEGDLQQTLAARIAEQIQKQQMQNPATAAPAMPEPAIPQPINPETLKGLSSTDIQAQVQQAQADLAANEEALNQAQQQMRQQMFTNRDPDAIAPIQAQLDSAQNRAQLSRQNSTILQSALREAIKAETPVKPITTEEVGKLINEKEDAILEAKAINDEITSIREKINKAESSTEANKLAPDILLLKSRLEDVNARFEGITLDQNQLMGRVVTTTPPEVNQALTTLQVLNLPEIQSVDALSDFFDEKITKIQEDEAAARLAAQENEDLEEGDEEDEDEEEDLAAPPPLPERPNQVAAAALDDAVSTVGEVDPGANEAVVAASSLRDSLSDLESETEGTLQRATTAAMEGDVEELGNVTQDVAQTTADLVANPPGLQAAQKALGIPEGSIPGQAEASATLNAGISGTTAAVSQMQDNIKKAMADVQAMANATLTGDPDAVLKTMKDTTAHAIDAEINAPGIVALSVATETAAKDLEGTPLGDVAAVTADTLGTASDTVDQVAKETENIVTNALPPLPARDRVEDEEESVADTDEDEEEEEEEYEESDTDYDALRKPQPSRAPSSESSESDEEEEAQKGEDELELQSAAPISKSSRGSYFPEPHRDSNLLDTKLIKEHFVKDNKYDLKEDKPTQITVAKGDTEVKFNKDKIQVTQGTPDTYNHIAEYAQKLVAAGKPLVVSINNAASDESLQKMQKAFADQGIKVQTTNPALTEKLATLNSEHPVSQTHSEPKPMRAVITGDTHSSSERLTSSHSSDDDDPASDTRSSLGSHH